MTFSANASSQSSEINVTPLIDVLLVLLIIFMVLVPTKPRGLETLVPQAPKDAPQTTPDTAVVVQVLSGGALPVYKINDSTFAKAAVEPELEKIFETRQEKVMFVKGDKELNFDSVAEVINFGHQANVTHIGILTPQIEAGQ